MAFKMFAKLDPALEATGNAEVRFLVAVFEIVDMEEVVKSWVLHIADNTLATPLGPCNESSGRARIFGFVLVNFVGVST